MERHQANTVLYVAYIIAPLLGMKPSLISKTPRPKLDRSDQTFAINPEVSTIKYIFKFDLR